MGLCAVCMCIAKANKKYYYAQIKAGKWESNLHTHSSVLCCNRAMLSKQRFILLSKNYENMYKQNYLVYPENDRKPPQSLT